MNVTTRRSLRIQNAGRTQSLNESPVMENSPTNEILTPELQEITLERDRLKRTYDELRDTYLNAICKFNMLNLSVDRQKNEFNNLGLEMNSIESEREELQRSIECKICLCAQMDVIFHPCRHVIACDSCATRLTQCPYCRTIILEVLPIYF